MYFRRINSFNNFNDLCVLCYIGKAPDIEKPIGTYPYLVEQPKTKRKVPVVQAFHITKYLGQLWLEFDSAGEVTKSYGNPILLDSHIEQGKIKQPFYICIIG